MLASSAGAQPSQSDYYKPANRGFGRHVAGCCEGVEAVARELVRRDIVPEVAGLCDLGQQASYHVVDLLLRSGDVHTSMQECSEFGAGVLMGKALVGEERVGLKHSFELLSSAYGLVSDFGEMFEVTGDLTFVPGEQNRFDVWKVLVQRCTSNAGLLGDL